MQRLFDMKLAEGAEGIDVIRLVEQQPALLLAAGPEGGSESDESADARLAAWRHGLVSDGAAEWGRRYEQLRGYRQRYGDAHVGYRDGDDAELGRWAAKQRSEAASGQLDQERRAALEALGFEFDGERAEWLRWLTEIRTFREREGHCQPQPLAHPNGGLGAQERDRSSQTMRPSPSACLYLLQTAAYRASSSLHSGPHPPPPTRPAPPSPCPLPQTSCSSTGAPCSASCGAATCWPRSASRCSMSWASTGAEQTRCPETASCAP